MSQATKTIILNVDRNLATDFKSATAKRDNRMSDVLVPVVVKAMNDYLHKAEQESTVIKKAAHEIMSKIN